jgi:Flp pilus assembly protein TadD
LLTRALEVDPEQERARFALAQIYDNLGRRDEAATEFARVVDSLHRKLEAEPGDADARLNLARVLERQGRKPEAEAEYRRLAAMTSASPQAKAIARNRLAAAGR